jgi:hypothetical protein
MKPTIDNTQFGSISIDGKQYNHDVIIRLNGRVDKRKKKLSKVKYGTSHIISLEEIKYIYETGADRLIIGSGQYGLVDLSEEAAEFLITKNCVVMKSKSPDAINKWNKAKGKVISLFHVTC